MTDSDKDYSLDGLCKALGKGPFYIKNLQRHIGLPRLGRGKRYSESYLTFMKKLVALRTFSVTYDMINELYEKEKKLLKMLHFDSLSESDTWCLDSHSPELSENCLMLTGVDVGFRLNGHQVQHNLDFGEKDPELFKSVEMGEDIRRVLDKYLDLVKEVDGRVHQETMVLKDALSWAQLWKETWITGNGKPPAKERPKASPAKDT